KMLLGILLVSSCVRAGGSSEGNEYSIKAMFLLNFIKYVEWPIESTKNTFQIGVIGESEMFDALTMLTSKRSAEGQKVVIKRFEEKNSENYQMIFISNSDSQAIDELTKKYSAKGVLIITEEERGKARQSGINLFNQDNRIRFEINLPVIKNNGLKVSSKLLELATKVHQ
nr:YfiR family protein [Bacteroidia bacterium]